MTTYKIKHETEIEITPKQMADLFWDMDDDDQVIFFKRLLEKNTVDFENQMWSVRNKMNNSERKILLIMAGVE